MTVARDNFTRANGALGANWTSNSGAFTTLTLAIASNACIVSSNTGAPGAAFWSANSFAANQYSQCPLQGNHTGSTLHGAGPTVRAATGDNYYRFFANIQNTASNIGIVKVVAGVATTLTGATRTMAIGDFLRLEVIGSTLTAYVNGVLVLTATDTSLTTGSPGLTVIMANAADTIFVPNWEGGDIVPAAQTIQRDTFTRGDSGTLGANWTANSGATSTATIGITSNAAKVQTTGGNAASFYSASTFSADHYSQVLVSGSALGTNSHGGGPTVRGSAGDNYYRVLANLANTASNVSIAKVVGGTFTALATGTQTFALGDLLRLEAVGTQISFYVNGTLILSANDSALATGAPGVCAFMSAASPTSFMTKFEGGNLIWKRSGTIIGIGSNGGSEEPTVMYEGSPQVLSANPDGKIWKMWETDGWSAGSLNIYYWESNDGVNWTAYGSNPVITGPNIAHGSVFHFQNTYYGYYITDIPTSSIMDIYQSSDGVTGWTKTVSSALTIGGVATWDHLSIANPIVWAYQGTFYMLYEGRSVTNYSFGLATAPAPAGPWTKYVSNPVNTTSGSTDMSKMAPVLNGGLWYLLDHGSASGNLPSDLYMWSSPDLHTWTGASKNPTYVRVLATEGANLPAAGQVADPSWVELNGTTFQFHDATNAQSSGHIQIEMETAPYTINQLLGMLFATWIISGNAGVAGATVSYSGTATGSVIADSAGNYTIPVTVAGPYTIIPSFTGRTFTPTSSSQTVSTLDIIGVNFTSSMSGSGSPSTVTITMLDSSSIVLSIPTGYTATQYVQSLRRAGGVWSASPDPSVPATWWPYRDWQKFVTS